MQRGNKLHSSMLLQEVPTHLQVRRSTHLNHHCTTVPTAESLLLVQEEVLCLIAISRPTWDILSFAVPSPDLDKPKIPGFQFKLLRTATLALLHTVYSLLYLF